MVSGWCLRVSGNVLIPGYQDIAIPNPLAKFELGHTWILPFLPVPSIAQMSMSVGVWMVFEGVWIMSRWCLRVSGEASIPNLLAKTMLSYDTQILHFLSMPCIA